MWSTPWSAFLLRAIAGVALFCVLFLLARRRFGGERTDEPHEGIDTGLD